MLIYRQIGRHTHRNRETRATLLSAALTATSRASTNDAFDAGSASPELRTHERGASNPRRRDKAIMHRESRRHPFQLSPDLTPDEQTKERKLVADNAEL